MPTTGIENWSYGNALANQAKTRASSGRDVLSKTETSPEDRTSLSMNDFYKLLAAQMQYQNPDSPMDTSQMVSSMAQNMLVTATTQMTQAIEQMSSINLTTYASSMIGKTIRVALTDDDGRYTGETMEAVVEGASLYDGVPKLFIDGKFYELAQIMSVGSVPEPPKEGVEIEQPNEA